MSDEKGIKKEDTNWFIKLITLGDRFDPQDFFDRFKKAFVEFLVVFFGVLISFSVERQGESFGDRQDGIENLHNLREEIEKIKLYTLEYSEQIVWVTEMYSKQYSLWEVDNDSIFLERFEDEEGEFFTAPMSLYTQRDPFDPPRVTYDAIKLDGTFRLLDTDVGKKMTDTYDGSDLKYLIENTGKIEESFVNQFVDRIANHWVFDLENVDLEDTSFWVKNRRYIQADKFVKYNLFKRLDLWNNEIAYQLEQYVTVLDESMQLLDSVITEKDEEIEIIWWVIDYK
ncbi:MAG: hypothetical protein CBC80_002325 [Flavobacteriaceae bacterium TMED120]|nr:MAG: hypothetical protein CBC80_002325 [Flavobacteriaceae bacterium TMED120]